MAQEEHGEFSSILKSTNTKTVETHNEEDGEISDPRQNEDDYDDDVAMSPTDPFALVLLLGPSLHIISFVSGYL